MMMRHGLSRRTRRTVLKSLKSLERLALEQLEVRQVLDSTVVFNEVMYNPAGADDGPAEWIEFHNQLTVDMDISDWVLSGGVDYKFPDKTIVPGKGYIVVAANPAALKQATGVDALGPWTGQLNNAGEVLTLYNNDDRLMNELDYGDAGHWPVAPDGGGPSLAKARRDTATEDVRNWTFSAEIGGTPGRANFVQPGESLTTQLLSESTQVRAMVPSNNNLGTSWIQTGFNDASWLSGKMGVGYSTRASSFDAFFGLDLDAPPNGQAAMPMVNVNTSVYIRVPFTNDGTKSFDQLTLRLRYDDGFVAYLNGVEVASDNAPGRDGNLETLTWNSLATANHADTAATTYENFDLTPFLSSLKPGENVLAIHGLARSLTDTNALFDAQLVARSPVTPLPPAALEIHEVAAVTDAAFFVEVRNTSNAALPLAGHVLRTDDPTDGRYVFPAQTLSPGQYLSINKAALGLTLQDSDRLILESPSGRILDGVAVESKLKGRAASLDGAWQYPQAATPGAANSIQLQSDIVINEIMYNPFPKLGVPDKPPTFEQSKIVEMTSRWRYNDVGSQYTPGWQQQSYNVDGSTWKEGAGLIGFDTAALAVPINTTVKQPSLNDPRFLTYYFQTDFNLTAGQLADIDQLMISHMVDSGAVFYLNGEEVLRFNMPTGTIEATTPAATSVSDAARVGPINIPHSMLKVGKNTLSAELHLRSLGASDVAFGAELVAGKETSPAVPGTPYEARDEYEWLELYNKGIAPVDLSGWKFTDGIDFEFPAGTVVGPNQYLVVARNAAVLSPLYPNTRIVGDFGGSLSNSHDWLRLVDGRGNLADEVEYYDTQPWPLYADGGGSSIELRDPSADNNRPESWADSDESSKSEWITHTFSGTALRDVYNQAALFHEFLFGLLDAGEFLLDDVVVLKNPNSPTPVSLLQNGTFESDAVGSSPAKWRLIGNHSGVVVTDPTNANNKALHVTVTGAQAFVHDHAETTFANSEKIVDGTEYSITFRAKWLGGNSQLNNRLWFNRLPSTAILDVPDKNGTPGAVNTQKIANAGPTYEKMRHSPTTPQPTEPTTVSVEVNDPQNVRSVVLNWRVDRGTWNVLPMTQGSDGRYQATVPPQTAGTIVQFYVQAEDGQGVASMYPAEGPDSRALYQVDDGKGPSTPIDKVRLVVMRAEHDKLFANTNRMSNWRLPMTLIYNDEAFYDAGVRFTGSRWIRPNSGYRVDLPAGQFLYGIHDNIRLDINGLAEMVMKQMLNRAGGSKANNYDDAAYLVSRNHTTEFILQLARYENTYLDEQFVNGSDGTKWELDDVTVPTGPVGGVEGLKADTAVYEQADFGVNTTVVNQQGANPEFYRGHVLIKSARDQDNYSAIARFAQAIHKSGDELFEASNEVMDVDLWMRHYAHQSYFGNWDTYGFGRPKNLRIYERPEDGKIIPFFWDCDLCNFTETIKKASEPTSRLDEIRDIPHNLRLYWGHMLDLITRSFNESYVSRWAAHYGELFNNVTGGGDETFQTITTSTRTRSNQALNAMRQDIPVVDFSITTNQGQDIVTDSPTIILEGKGWIDIRSLRLAGTTTPLDAFWPTEDGWRIELPLKQGQQTIALEAIGYQSQLIGTKSIKVTSTAVNPAMNSLRLTEIQYNPAAPSAIEIAAGFTNNNDFEYIELTNIGQQAISLDQVELVRTVNGNEEQGVEFRFAGSNVTSLNPGQSVVVVESLAAFRARYGNTPLVAGEWSGGLSNTSERLSVTVQGASLHEFTYLDSWYPTTDGTGPSLEIITPSTTALNQWGQASSWRASTNALGSPGTTSGRAPGDSNGDGVFNSADLVYVMQFGEYEDLIAGNSTFEEGDWNGDGDFTSSDLVHAFAFGSYVSAARPAAIREDRTTNVDAIFGEWDEPVGSVTPTNGDDWEMFE